MFCYCCLVMLSTVREQSPRACCLLFLQVGLVLLVVCWGVSFTLARHDVRAVTSCRGGLDMFVATF